jgi:Skp family chaperone for outer membrane proteins
MRIFLMACFAAATLSVANAASVPAPHILVVNRSALHAANSDVDKAAMDAAVQTVLQQLMREYGANIVLDRDWLFAGDDKVDITAQTLEQLQKAMPAAGVASAPQAGFIDAAFVSAPRILVLNRAELAHAHSNMDVGPESDLVHPILQQLMRERGANLLLARFAIVYSTDGAFDITPDVLQRLPQRSTIGPPEPLLPANSNPIAPPMIIVIDRNAVLQGSSVGRDVARQVSDYTAKAQADLTPQSNALRAERDALQQQISASTPGAHAEEAEAFNIKQQAFARQVQERQSQIQQGVEVVHEQINRAISSIIQDLTREHGANLLIDSSAVVSTSTGVFDITKAAMQRLDEKLPSVKVELLHAIPATVEDNSNCGRGVSGKCGAKVK